MRLILVLGLLCAAPFAAAAEVEGALFSTLEAALERGRQAELPLLAPESWAAAAEAHGRARESFERNRSLETIERQIAESTAALERANALAPEARTLFGGVLHARRDALSAGADSMAQKNWTRAEERFHDAAVALERGRADRGQRDGDEALEVYRAAELEAIQGAILIDVRELLEQAERENVDKHAPKALAAARQSLADAERFLVEDRYDLDRPRLIARQAREEASHALYLAALVKAIDDGDLELEQALTDGELPVLRIADALDITPDVSNGVAATTDAILTEAKRLHKREAELTLAVDERDERIATLEAALGGAAQEAMVLNSLLAEQELRRSQAVDAAKILGERDAEVLRDGDSVVIRLVGLRFASGTADLRPEHNALLGKLQRALAIFPDTTFSIEGHTDSFGSDTDNFELSQRRAEIVRNFLVTRAALPAYRVSATGFGESRPIASNQTVEGRARNRRIDVVVVRG
jgi:outer membrane protein OmpA-like peptidoglycan-associated protein